MHRKYSLILTRTFAGTSMQFPYKGDSPRSETHLQKRPVVASERKLGQPPILQADPQTRVQTQMKQTLFYVIIRTCMSSLIRLSIGSPN